MYVSRGHRSQVKGHRSEQLLVGGGQDTIVNVCMCERLSESVCVCESVCTVSRVVLYGYSMR